MDKTNKLGSDLYPPDRKTYIYIIRIRKYDLHHQHASAAKIEAICPLYSFRVL